MKIATFNVEFLFGEGVQKHSGKEWIYTKEFVQARIDRLSSIISEINADIIFLQEVASEDVIKRIIEKTGINYFHFLATPKNGVGNAVLYKQKDVICESIPAKTNLPIFVEGDEDIVGSRIWSRRDFVGVTTTFNEKKLFIIGVHIKANFLVEQKNADKTEIFPMNTQITAADGLIRSELFRFSQAKRVREFVDDKFSKDPEALVIVAGDFSSTEEVSAFRIIRGVIATGSDSLFRASQKVSDEKRFSRIIDKKILIDHILISKSLESHLGTVKILNEHITDHTNIAPNPSFVESDHAPMFIELI